MSELRKRLDLAALRARLGGARGRDYWRSLDDLASTAEFETLLKGEFPHAFEEPSAEGRRNFLKVMGASLALAGLTACTRQPAEQIVPYAQAPEDLVPGKPLFFATAMPLAGAVSGLLVESHEGRPTKVEGNPGHPSTLGACDVFSQASVLQLYDPDRSQALSFGGQISSWKAFHDTLRDALAQQRAKGGAGLRILTETVVSPTLGAQLRDVRRLYPGAKWHQWDPAGAHSARQGAVQAFGQPLNTYYQFSKAEVVLSLDADFLGARPGQLHYARQFAARRRVRGSETSVNRLYVAEPMPTPTGSKADHRLPLRAGDIEEFAWAVATVLGAANGPRQGPNADIYRWAGPVGRDLLNHKGASIVIAGDGQPPAVHALAHMMNHFLGNVGKTVFYTEPVEENPTDQVASLRDLVNDLDAGQVDLLLVIGGNPVYTAPVELGLRGRLQKARLRVRLGLYDDETSEVCQWQLPESHYLETWSDARAFDGTVTIMQPLIHPLYETLSAHQLVQLLLERPGLTPYQIVRGYWQTQRAGADFEAWWRRALHDGVAAGTAFEQKTPVLKGGAITGRPPKPHGGTLEIVFRPDPTVWDGRFANNGWLQELPKPVTNLTWDNAAVLSPGTAHRLDVANGQVLELEYKGRKLKAPVFLQPGHANGSITVYLGYGRTRAGRVGTGMGFNAFGLRTADALGQDYGLRARKTSGNHALASTQNFHALDPTRHIIRKANIEDFRKNPAVVHEGAGNPPRELTMYPGFKYEGYAWGMAIDLNACTGCGACTLACQAENNIAVVGKDQVRRGRAMHWIRVDNYYHGDINNPELYSQPVPCMQCENAPCELVCPVQATAHSAEGLNDMVYNRCVGTRYCSNNCPYKVRRFNFYQFADFETPTLKLLHNPDVSVRSRGVMEKCTYCVQRINAAKIAAGKENRKVRDGEIQTACQAACPAEAIVFGDINDPDSRVSRLKAEKSNYGLLEDLNTRPRTTYLAVLRNPNPEFEA